MDTSSNLSLQTSISSIRRHSRKRAFALNLELERNSYRRNPITPPHPWLTKYKIWSAKRQSEARSPTSSNSPKALSTLIRGDRQEVPPDRSWFNPLVSRHGSPASRRRFPMSSCLGRQWAWLQLLLCWARFRVLPAPAVRPMA